MSVTLRFKIPTTVSQAMATCLAMNIFVQVFSWRILDSVLYVTTAVADKERVINALGEYGFKLINED